MLSGLIHNVCAQLPYVPLLQIINWYTHCQIHYSSIYAFTISTCGIILHLWTACYHPLWFSVFELNIWYDETGILGGVYLYEHICFHLRVLELLMVWVLVPRFYVLVPRRVTFTIGIIRSSFFNSQLRRHVVLVCLPAHNYHRSNIFMIIVLLLVIWYNSRM